MQQLIIKYEVPLCELVHKQNNGIISAKEKVELAERIERLKQKQYKKEGM